MTGTPQPPGVPVTINASNGVQIRWSSCPIMVDFGNDLRFQLRPDAVNQVTVPPGRYRAKLYSLYFGIKVGKAEIDVDTSNWAPVTFSYAAPYTIYSKGAAGYGELKRPGGRGILVIIGIALAVPLLVVAITLLTTR